MTQTFTAAQIGGFLAGPRLSPETGRLRFKNFTANGYIPTRMRSETDRRGTILYSTGDVLIAAILSEMVDLGGLSKEAMRAAATRLHAWHIGEADPDGPKPPESPAQWMWRMFVADPATPPGFTLQVQWQRHPSGAVNCRAALSHGEYGELCEGMTLREGDVPVASLVIPIDPILLVLLGKIRRAGMN
ncbi:hypothetical protein [Roseisalinus antarcticus]|uniref:HTH merR-type domain-containing protein n=1 Tax=Roseisalinus antarcticus TaxID=254357 RepID=A0A1Y5TZV7_9RHOB|nr:hypothetical protein [Roseisalinus antarcticus]SLN77704.1 hypothetical protein ROA7023_04484 [Roseisalinus antarcticus]